MINLKNVKRFFETPKDPQVLVAEIHNEFDTVTERLLKEAQEIINKSDKTKIRRADRLKNLGFFQAEDVVATSLQAEAEYRSKKIADAIVYFQQWYPNNKFITHKEVERICEKYHLIYADVSFYKGDVPEKNILEIESFRLRDEDKELRIDYTVNLPKPTQLSFIICAPIKDFNTTNMDVRGFTLIDKVIHIPDPIVLQPVNEGYLVVSKWGLEGKDESLVNEKMN